VLAALDAAQCKAKLSIVHGTQAGGL